MPPNYQNSLGWLDLQLRSQRERDLQEQAFKREGMAREDRQLETQNSLALGRQAAQAMGDAENRKLQLADMMARADADRASREAIAGTRTETSRRGQDLTNDDRDLERARKIKEDQERAKREALAARDRAYGLYTGRLTAVNPVNTVTGERPYQYGTELLRPPPSSIDELESVAPSETSAPPTTEAPPTASPAAAPPPPPPSVVPGVTNTPPPGPGEAPLSRTARDKALEKAGGDVEDLQDLDEAVTAMESPDVNKADFGETGGRFSLFGITPNTAKDWAANSKVLPAGIKDWFGGEKQLQKGALVRSNVKMKVEKTINKMARKYGAALTETELGRVLGEAGLQAAMSGKLDIAATDYEVLVQALKETRKRFGDSAARTSKELETGKRRLAPTSPTSPTRREPSAQLSNPPQRGTPEHKAAVRKLMQANQGMTIQEAIKQVEMPRDIAF